MSFRSEGQAIRIRREYSGSTDKLQPLYEHYQKLIATVKANFVGTKGSKKEAQGSFEATWVWDVEGKDGSGLKLVLLCSL